VADLRLVCAINTTTTTTPLQHKHQQQQQLLLLLLLLHCYYYNTAICVCSKGSQRTIEELRKNVADLETRLRNETSRIKTRYETQFHEFEMQADVLSRSNAELTKNNKGLLTKIKV